MYFAKFLFQLTTDGDFIEDYALKSLITYWPDIHKPDLEKIAHFCAGESE